MCGEGEYGSGWHKKTFGFTFDATQSFYSFRVEAMQREYEGALLEPTQMARPPLIPTRISLFRGVGQRLLGKIRFSHIGAHDPKSPFRPAAPRSITVAIPTTRSNEVLSPSSLFIRSCQLPLSRRTNEP